MDFVTVVGELSWFLPWSVGTNIALNALGFFSYCFPTIGRRDAPFDFGLKLQDGERLLGDSTTWGGLVLMLVVGIAGSFILPEHPLIALAILVFFGHALGSFVKRRIGLKRGEFLPLVDHGDYILLAGTTFALIGEIHPLTIFISYVAVIAVTPLVTHAAHTLHLRRERL